MSLSETRFYGQDCDPGECPNESLQKYQGEVTCDRAFTVNNMAELRKHVFELSEHQKLTPRDPDRRLEFARILERINEDPDDATRRNMVLFFLCCYENRITLYTYFLITHVKGNMSQPFERYFAFLLRGIMASSNLRMNFEFLSKNRMSISHLKESAVGRTRHRVRIIPRYGIKIEYKIR